jgi:hypothetical protein
MTEMKLCRNCKWRGRRWLIEERNQLCHQPDVVKAEYVKFGDDRPFATLARQFGPCGRVGRLYEPR